MLWTSGACSFEYTDVRSYALHAHNWGRNFHQVHFWEHCDALFTFILFAQQNRFLR